MIYGIILVYYDKYRDSAIEKFDCLLKSINEDYKIIIVNNAINYDKSNYLINEIEGKNVHWEFSGWDEGIKSLGGLKDDDVIILANDTFCHHNKWDYFTKLFFSRGFRSVYNKNLKTPGVFLSGTTDTFWQTFSILDKKSSLWASTYLFLITSKLLKEMGGKVSIEEDDLDRLVKPDGDKAVLFGGEISENLQRHISKWMFPKDETEGWYNSNKIDPARRVRKIKTILNEKYISASCLDASGEVIEVNPIKKIKLKIKRIIG
ncbi:hypothetical protein ASF13_19330 [Erwinia sp. Leaf53]|nr:hypothetical protein ASF13_19330 [Erwinia sp. Leaf53]